MKIQQLYDQRAKLVEEARAVLDKVTDDTPDGEMKEIEARFDQMMDDAEAIKKRIDREERLIGQETALDEVAERRAARRTISGEQRSVDEHLDQVMDEMKVFGKFLRGGHMCLSDQERRALHSVVMTPDNIGAGGIAEVRAQGVGDTGSGAELVPEGFIAILESAMLAFGGVRGVSTVRGTATGGDLPYPTSNDTGNEGELLAEHATAAAQDVGYGNVILGAYKFSSKVVRVSYELLQDSAIDIAADVGDKLGERIARITNRKFTLGTGTGEPKGVVVAAVEGKETASTNAFTVAELQDLIHSVDQSYRPSGTFMMNDSYVKQVAKFTVSTTDNRPIWVPSTREGEPDRILGYPYVTNNHMASALTASTYGILFGDFSKYLIRDVRQVFLVRLNELYATQGQVGFVAFSRHDGDLLDAGTNPLKSMQLATS